MTDDTQNVVTHTRFTGRAPDAPEPQPVELDTLRKVGLVTGDLPEIDALDLKEPGYGEDVVGTLTADEASVFVGYYRAFEEFKERERQIGGDFLMKAGERMKSSKEDVHIEYSDVATEEQVVPLFRAQRRAAALREVLFWQISERIGHHDWMLSVRSKGRIVRLSRKW